MKKIDCDFSKLVFDRGSFLDSIKFSQALLAIRVRFFEAQIGEGEEIQALDIPEATLYFKDLSFCERSIWPLDAMDGVEARVERENLPEKADDTNPEFTVFGESDEPPGLVQWDIRAANFDLDLEDEVYEKLVKSGFTCRLTR